MTYWQFECDIILYIFIRLFIIFMPKQLIEERNLQDFFLCTGVQNYENRQKNVNAKKISQLNTSESWRTV